MLMSSSRIAVLQPGQRRAAGADDVAGFQAEGRQAFAPYGFAGVGGGGRPQPDAGLALSLIHI